MSEVYSAPGLTFVASLPPLGAVWNFRLFFGPDAGLIGAVAAHPDHAPREWRISETEWTEISPVTG